MSEIWRGTAIVLGVRILVELFSMGVAENRQKRLGFLRGGEIARTPYLLLARQILQMSH